MIDFVETNFEYGFAKSNIPQVSRVYFEAISVGVSAALKVNPNIKTSKKETSTWIWSKEFREMIAGKYETHSPKRIKDRINYVKNALLKSK